jgi:small subunit ribosomal protein S8
MHTDPVADLLTRIRNAYNARLGKLVVPRSNMLVRILDILAREGFIGGYNEVAQIGPQQQVEVQLRYGNKGVPAIAGIRRVSKPSLRKYSKCRNIPHVRSGLGIMILTTSQGMMTDYDARKRGIGGEAVCTVW